jgi:hypothetical protein
VTKRPVLEQAFRDLPTTFVRLKGRNGVTREYRALLSPTSEYCVLPSVYAYRLGYPEAANDSRLPSPNSVAIASYVGYGRGTVIRMAQVELGDISLRDIEFLTFDILQSIGLDVVLGLTLLRHMHLDLDFASHRLRLEAAGGAQ